MMEKTCEICGKKKGEHTCVSCGRTVCTDCYWVQVGVCKDCAKGKEKTNVLADILKECGAIKFGTFKLASGRETSYYVDIKKAGTEPEILGRIAEEMEKYMDIDVKRIAGVELGAVPIAVALSLKTGIPYLIIRKEEKTHGTGRQIEGGLNKGERVLLVEDVTTTGASVAKAIDVLRKAGAEVERVLVVVDREEGAENMLAGHGVKLIPMVKISEVVTNAL